jgi:hypothetical protein
MENRIDSYLARWNILRMFSLVWLLLTFALVTLSFPPWFQLIATFGSVIGLLLGLMAVLKGDWVWARNAVFVAGLMFFGAVFGKILLKTVAQDLPALLLEFLMVMYTVELLALLSKQRGLYSRDVAALDIESSVPILRKSMEMMFEHLSRLGLIFGSCYLATIGILYIGSILASFAPALSDISLYIVVVSTSLALLLSLREEQPTNEGLI